MENDSDTRDTEGSRIHMHQSKRFLDFNSRNAIVQGTNKKG